MKMLMIFCTAPGATPLLELLEGMGLRGYTLIPEVFGAGQTGRHMGTRAHPGVSSLVLLTVPEADAGRVLQALEEHRGQCAPGEGFHAVQLAVEKAIAGAHGA
jgi:hypothetical protein